MGSQKSQLRFSGTAQTPLKSRNVGDQGKTLEVELMMRSDAAAAPSQPTPDFAETSARLSGTALRAFFAIADSWKLTPPQARVLLGSLPESTYFKYAKTPDSAKLSRDTLERISHITGIFKALNVLLPRAEAADEWVHRPNDAPLLKGRSALEHMLGGSYDDIADVRRYLDTQRSW